jgi:hypothetical protein
MMLTPCPYAQSIAAYMTLTVPVHRPFVKMDLAELREAKIIESQQRPVERKGLGENVDTYA